MPLLLSVAFQQLYQMADSMIVGRFAESAQAGELARKLSDHAAVRCCCDRHQHRHLRPRLAAVRREALPAHEDRDLDRPDHHDRRLAAADAVRRGLHQRSDECAQYLGGYFRGRLALSSRLCVRSAVPVHLQRVHRHFQRHGRQPDAAVPAHPVLGRQRHPRRRIRCHAALGRCRRCMGDLYRAGRIGRVRLLPAHAPGARL